MPSMNRREATGLTVLRQDPGSVILGESSHDVDLHDVVWIPPQVLRRIMQPTVIAFKLINYGGKRAGSVTSL